MLMFVMVIQIGKLVLISSLVSIFLFFSIMINKKVIAIVVMKTILNGMTMKRFTVRRAIMMKKKNI